VKNAARLLQDIARRDSTILLVDEQAETRQVSQDFFAGLGCRVVTANDLHTAAAVLRSVTTTNAPNPPPPRCARVPARFPSSPFPPAPIRCEFFWKHSDALWRKRCPRPLS
jgi:hypothetical protein